MVTLKCHRRWPYYGGEMPRDGLHYTLVSTVDQTAYLIENSSGFELTQTLEELQERFVEIDPLTPQ